MADKPRPEEEEEKEKLQLSKEMEINPAKETLQAYTFLWNKKKRKLPVLQQYNFLRSIYPWKGVFFLITCFIEYFDVRWREMRPPGKKNHSYHLSILRVSCTCNHICCKRFGCFQSRRICRYHDHIQHQRWVHAYCNCTLLFVDFGIVSTLRDYILWRYRERRWKLYWRRKNLHKNRLK